MKFKTLNIYYISGFFALFKCSEIFCPCQYTGLGKQTYTISAHVVNSENIAFFFFYIVHHYTLQYFYRPSHEMNMIFFSVYSLQHTVSCSLLKPRCLHVNRRCCANRTSLGIELLVKCDHLAVSHHVC